MPSERPASAREVLREVIRLSAGAETPAEVDLGVPYPEGDPLAGIFVGRRIERAALRAALDRLADGAAPVSTLALVGPPGSGRRALFDVVARELAVAGAAGTAPVVQLWRGGFDALAAWLRPEPVSPSLDPQRAAEARLAAISEALEARAREQPLCVWLDEGPAAVAFATWVAGAPPSGRVLLALPAREAPTRPFADAIALGPLTEADVEALIAGAGDVAVPAGAAAALTAQAQGNAAVVGVLARRLIADLRAGRAAGARIDAGADLDGLLADGYRALPAPAQALVLALALTDGAGDAAAIAELRDGAGATAGARAAGWLESISDGGTRLPSAAHRRAALAASDPASRARVARRALAVLGGDDPRRVDALVAAGQSPEAVALLRRAAAQAARADGVPARAALFYERAAALEPDALDAPERLALATGLGLLGRYEDAARALETARAAAGDGATRAACAERDAWLRARRGDTEGARVALERGLAEGADDAAGAELRARLGRLLVTSGRFRDALDTVEPLFADASGAVTASVRAVSGETAVLAYAYLGQAERARDALATLERAGGLGAGRGAYLGALLAQLAGREADALAGYRRAYESASRDGDVHTVASVALNLAALLAEQGVYGEALAASERAVRELGRLGAAAELATALVNGANIFVQVGDLAAARRALERARGLAVERKLTLALAAATFVEGDLGLRAGQPREAAALYRSASAAFIDGGQPHRAASALYAAAEAAAVAGLADDGRRALAEADALRVPADDDAERARALAVLALADGGGEPAPAAADRLDRLAHRARSVGRRPQALRLSVLAARLAQRAGAANKVTETRRFARTIMEEIRMATPEHHRAGLERDPDALFVLGSDAARGDDAAVSARALAAEGRLRRLLRINKRLNSELRLPRLLEMIVDTVIELTDAERGFLLLEDESGQLEVKVARNIDQRTLETAEFELSRSIAHQAAAGGEPIVTIDAAGDARFREAVSVSDLHLRSVLAVPLSIKGRVAGTIYVDHRLRKGAFDQEDVRLVLDFAEQAAIALENARLLAELRRRERQVEALNRRLEVELAARREELTGIKQELRENREALAVRYDYRNIIGKHTAHAGPVPAARSHHRHDAAGRHPGRERHGQGAGRARDPLERPAPRSPLRRRELRRHPRDPAGIDAVRLRARRVHGRRARHARPVRGRGRRHAVPGRGRGDVAGHAGKAAARAAAGRAAPGRERAHAQGRRPHPDRDQPRSRADGRGGEVPARSVLPVERRADRAAAAARSARRHPDHGRPLPGQAGEGRRPSRAQAARARGAGADGRPSLAGQRARAGERDHARGRAVGRSHRPVRSFAPGRGGGGPGASVADDPDSLLLKPRVERLERSLLREALGRAANNQTKAAEILGLSRFGLQKKLKRYNFSV